MQSVLQILKLNEARSGVSKTTGKPWEMQDAECLILSAEGVVDEVGVLMIPKELMGKVAPGVYLGTFALRADKSREGGRRIMPVLVGLQPFSVPRPAQPARAST
jgi:hypothetical protein